jgi:predicted aspartyl protease
MRHDTPDSAYVALGQGYDAVGYFAGSAGLLVGSRWVLTAGHVAQSLTPFTRTIEFRGEAFEVIGTAFHPTWEGAASEKSVDMALLKLDRVVKGIDPVALYSGDDEVGMQALFVGRGKSGDGETGPVSDDGVLRGAHNVVDGIMFEYITFVFDEPPAGVPLEGISGPGDSGGPALIRRNGRLMTIGVSSGNSGKPICRYRTMEAYTRVSTSREWIEKTMQNDEVEPLAARGIANVEDGVWPEADVVPAARQFFKCFESGDDAEFRRLEETFRADVDVLDRVGERVKRMKRVQGLTGALRPVQAVVEGQDLIVIAEATKARDDGGHWWSIHFVAAAGRFREVRLQPSHAPNAKGAMDAEIVEVTFELIHNQIVVPVRIMDRGPFNMLLDTGVTPSVMDRSTAIRIGLSVAPQSSGEASGVGSNTVQLYNVALTRLEVGALRIDTLEAVAVDLSPLAERMGRAVDGILGYSFLKHRIVQIDYPGRRLRILTRGPVNELFEGSRERHTLPLDLVPGDIIPRIAELHVNGAVVPVSLDTGSSLTLELYASAIQPLGLEALVKDAEATRVTGARGNANMTRATLDSMALGPFMKSRPEVIFNPKWQVKEKRLGNVGNGFLKDFVVTLDYPGRQITIEAPVPER